MAERYLEPIAVIGIAVKFPQEASTLSSFWDLLLRGGSTHTEIPLDRYNAEAFYRAEALEAKTGTTKARHGHFIAEPLDRFDAPFFSITPHEAECMDPQQRWLLECSYHALENAGLTLDQINGSNTSVHVGYFMNDHETMVYKDPEMPNTYQSTGNASALLANRISWFYNLTGPSMAVNSACSGSLVALHLACQSLRAGETAMGLVCGSNLVFAPETTIGLSSLNLLSPDGKCYSFDERANGYARGEGIASLIIKPLSNALRDGDNIRALIRGTGVNSDGRTPGILKPNLNAQVRLIRETYKRFGLDPSLTRYFEAHATGTQIGDSLEAESIATAFSREMRGGKPLIVGALKTNIGHLEGASGLAGVIKTILVLENSLIPPNVWLDKLNPAVKEEWALTFPTRLSSFPIESRRRASVNSFGFGGTNAHAILDDAETFFEDKDLLRTLQWHPPSDSPMSLSSSPILLTWSAADESGVARQLEAFGVYFQKMSCTEGLGDRTKYLYDLAYTLSLRRAHFSWRSFSICSSSETLCDLNFAPVTRVSPSPQCIFIFSSEGALWESMGQELMSYDCFRKSMEHSDILLRELGCQFSLLERLYKQQNTTPDSLLQLPEISHPIITGLQIALVELLASWNVNPVATIGYASGEIAAAFCSGLITKAVAIKLAFFRGLAVGAALKMNPPQGLGVDEAEYMQTAATLYRTFISAPPLDTGSNIDSLVSKCYFISTVTGEIFKPGLGSSEVSMPDYWIRNLLSPVRLIPAMHSLASLLDFENHLDISFVEIGPHSTIKSTVQESLPKQWDVEKSYTSVLIQHQSAVSSTLTVAGRLHCLGHLVDLHAVNNPSSTSTRSGKVLSCLPPYPFDHSKSRWLESRASKSYRLRSLPYRDFLGTRSLDWNPLEPQWNNRINMQENSFVQEHVVTGLYLYPAAAMLVMCIEAVQQINDSELVMTGFRFKDVEFSSSLRIPETKQGVETQLRLRPNEAGNLDATVYDFKLYKYDESWTLCCQGTIVVEYHHPALSQRIIEEHRQRSQMCRSSVVQETFYANLRSSGLNYGPLFQIKNQIFCGEERRGVADIDMRLESAQHASLIHPAALDCVFQTAFIGITQGGKNKIATMVPTSIKDLWISAHVGQRARGNSIVEVSAQSFPEQSRSHSVNYSGLLKDDQSPCIYGELQFKALDGAVPILRRDDDPVSLYHVEWKPEVDLLTSSAFNMSSGHTQAQPPDIQSIELKEQACLLAMLEASETAYTKTFINSEKPAHLEKYLQWIAYELEKIRGTDKWSRLMSYRQNEPQVQELLRKVGSSGSEGKVIAKLYNMLPQILEGKAEPLHVLFSDDTLSNYYRLENPPPAVTSGVQKYVDSLSHMNPGLSILEIGAGTGGMTKAVLDVLGGDLSASEKNRFSEYMFTDISPMFFQAATKQFGREGFQCKTLNIEKDLEEQGFAVGTYDLVIASNVLHATGSLSTTLSNARKLLRPGGKMILVEGINSNLLRTSFIFGCLPGWWLSSEPFREWGPLVSADRWNTLLRQNQFTGTDLIIAGPYSSTELSSAMISTASSGDPDSVSLVTVIRTKTSSSQRSLALHIKQFGDSIGAQIEIADSAREVSRGTCVFLNTMDEFSFESLNQEDYDTLKANLRRAKRILWVAQNDGSESHVLQQNAILGLCRSVLSESEGSQIVPLILQDIKNQQRATQHIWAVIRKYFQDIESAPKSSRSEEIVEIDEVLCVSRLLPAKRLESRIRRLESYEVSQSQDTIQKDSPSSLKPIAYSSSIYDGSRRVAPSSTRPLFQENATYVISGGLGGLGRSVARWMVSNGAKNLLLLSRKGGDKWPSKAFLADLKCLGVTVLAPKCDIADEKAVANIVQEAASSMPPIKGCIQGSMALESAMFQRMTLQQWRSTLRPKVQGSLNLHKVLSKDLDFFIMLSSLSGIIGASGLSNYAFGCAYQDALARYKIGIGQAAISIDLGIVDGVGYTAEHQGASSLMRSLGMQYISEEYLHALLRYYCDTDIKIQSPSEAQVVVGFMTEKRLRERGLVQPRSYTRSLMSHLRHFTPSVAQHTDLDKGPKKLPVTPAIQENPATEDKHRRQAAVSKAICGRLANILDLSINDISPAQALHTYGVDSLVAMEIRNWFKASMGKDVAVLDILSNISIDSLASRVA